MEANTVNLMQYAVGGASLFILIAVGIIALFIKKREDRIEDKEDDSRKKEEQSPLQQKSQKQQPSQKQQVNERQQVKQTQKVVQEKEVAPQTNQSQQELQELQQRQIMQKLRQNQQEHIKQAMQSPPIQPKQEVELKQQVQPNQKVSETKTLEIAFYKVQTTGKGENKAFFLDEYLNVGRNEGVNDWVIHDDPTVSGSHCRIYQKDGEVYILDLNSTNGTFVNEERVLGEMKLENHDKVRMGQSAYRIKF